MSGEGMDGGDMSGEDETTPLPQAEDLTILAETFRLLGDPTRLRILFFCIARPRAVGDIAEALGLSQSLVSHHLRLLRGARLVRAERRSRHVFYIVADGHVSGMLADMASHIAEERRGD